MNIKRLLFVLMCFFLLASCSDGKSEPQSPTNVTTHETSFSIHFVDVGQADAALVECDGHYMLIDGGNKEDSDLIYSILKKDKIEHLDMIIATHSHEDHIGGIPGALQYATTEAILSPVIEDDNIWFKDMKRYADKKDIQIEIPEVGSTYSLGSATVRILGLNVDSENMNDTSIVLKVEYGETSFLFTGDAEYEAEQSLLQSGFDLSATVLKVGHHGSSSSTSKFFLKAVKPRYAVISVGGNNDYGFPSKSVLNSFKNVNTTIYRTDLQGDIYCTSDGKTVSFTTAKEADKTTLYEATNKLKEESNANDNATMHYVLNEGSLKFHLPECEAVQEMNSYNKKEYEGTRIDLIKQGYSSCKMCNP